MAAGRRADRVVYTIHGFDTILKTYRIFLVLERLLATRCAAIVPVSDYDRRNLEAAGVGGRIVLIRNGSSDRRGAVPLDEGAAERINRAKASGAMIVLTIARLARPKRFDLFVEAARGFSASEARFFWIGNFEKVDPGSLPDNVEMLGELAEAGNYIKFCDVFALLSDYEGLPMSIIEALSAGKAIVASRVGGIGEMIDSHIGLLVENEAKAVIAALCGLFRDREDLAARGRAARIRYESGFSAETMWARYQELYKGIFPSSPA